MTLNNWLQTAQKTLKSKGVDSYPLDSLLILENITNFNRAHILAHPEKELSAMQEKQLNNLLDRRSKREPIAYILNKKEFYGREFFVNNNVLIPRPESESFIDLIKKHIAETSEFIDIGAGSGILGITTKLEFSKSKVILCDISKQALEVAEKNCNLLQAKCAFVSANLLPTDFNGNTVIANLPYVPKNLDLEPELAYEPKLALFADDDGLALYKKLWQQIGKSTTVNYVLTESLESQHSKMIDFAKNSDFKIHDTLGLVQIFIKAN